MMTRRTYYTQVLCIAGIFYLLALSYFGLRYFTNYSLRSGHRIDRQGGNPMEHIFAEAQRDYELWNRLVREAYAKDPKGFAKQLQNIKVGDFTLQIPVEPDITHLPLEFFIETLQEDYNAWLAYRKQLIVTLVGIPVLTAIVLLVIRSRTDLTST